MASTVWLVERLSLCESLFMVWRWIYSTHAGNGLCGCGKCNVTDITACLLVLSRLCCNSGIVCGRPVVGQTFLGKLGLLVEQDGALVVFFGLLSVSSAL